MNPRMPNKRIKFVPFGHPTRNGEAPLLAAYARRWAFCSMANLGYRSLKRRMKWAI